jgi:hypothetical protein
VVFPDPLGPYTTPCFHGVLNASTRLSFSDWRSTNANLAGVVGVNTSVVRTFSTPTSYRIFNCSRAASRRCPDDSRWCGARYSEGPDYRVYEAEVSNPRNPGTPHNPSRHAVAAHQWRVRPFFLGCYGRSRRAPCAWAATGQVAPTGQFLTRRLRVLSSGRFYF